MWSLSNCSEPASITWCGRGRPDWRVRGRHSSVMSAAYPILIRKVAPLFVGKDARQLEQTFHEAYLANSNYKWQGLPFWVSMAVVEIAILDLLGQAAGVPLGALFGKVKRTRIPVYRASSHRGNSPEAEIEYLQKTVAETGAKAVKFRLGARMRYDDASTRRDLALIPLTRKALGTEMAIYADANAPTMYQRRCAWGG